MVGGHGWSRYNAVSRVKGYDGHSMGSNSDCHDTVTQIIQSAQGGYTPDVAQSRGWNTRHHAEDKAGHRNPFKTNLSPCEVFTSLTSTRSSIYSSIDGSIHSSPIYY